MMDHVIDGENGVRLTRLEEEHIDPILRMMNREGWYYYDRRELLRYLKLEETCFVLKCGRNVIGCLFTTNYGNQAWLGNIIVSAESDRNPPPASSSKSFRNRGYAGRMIVHAMEILGETGVKTFRLGSVPTAIGAYKKVGFRAESFTTAQEVRLPLKFEDAAAELESDESLLPMTPEDVSRGVASLDETYFRSSRIELFRELFADSVPGSRLCLKKDNEIAGFIMIRRRLALKKEGGFLEGPDAAYRLGPCCVRPDIGLRGFRILLQKAMEPVHAEAERLEGRAKLYVVFPQNAVKSRIYAAFESMGGKDPDRVFNEHAHIFGSQPLEKNEELWTYMHRLGFRQEYFEQVMSVTPGEDSTFPEKREAMQTQANSEGIFATATPGDKA